MPELPEVETIVRQLNQAKLVGARIVQVLVLHPQVLEGISINAFTNKLTSQKFRGISRRGKFLVFELSQSRVLVHLRMTGKLFFVPPSEKHLKHVHVKLHLDDGRILYYEDPRRFGRWYVDEIAQEKMQELGVEPLSDKFTLKCLTDLLKAHSTQIKPFLLNQNHIAGLGNIYVDEALWEAKIHPKQITSDLTKSQIKHLHEAIQKVLKKGIANQGTTLGKLSTNYLSVSGKRGDNQEGLRVFRREGLTCPRCQQKIVKMIVAQRGTHICPNCQLAN